jgi:Family of unknown function (DUF5427)
VVRSGFNPIARQDIRTNFKNFLLFLLGHRRQRRSQIRVLVINNLQHNQVRQIAMTSKSKQEEARRFLDDLDSLSPSSTSIVPGGTEPGVAQSGHDGEAAEVLAFIDEITQKSAEPTRTTTSHIDKPLSRAGTPNLKKSIERVRVGTPGGLTSSSTSLALRPDVSATASASHKSNADQSQQLKESTQMSATGGWGWGSVWSSAAAAIQQAKSAVDEQVKHLPNEQARKWGEGVIEYARTAQLEKLGQYTPVHVLESRTPLNIHPIRTRLQKSRAFNLDGYSQRSGAPNIRTRGHTSLVESRHEGLRRNRVTRIPCAGQSRHLFITMAFLIR